MSVACLLLAKDIKLIEDVERRAAKLVHGIENWKYDDRLKFLSLTKLDKRTLKSNLVETFKILNGFYNINRDRFFDLIIEDVEPIKETVQKKILFGH